MCDLNHARPDEGMTAAADACDRSGERRVTVYMPVDVEAGILLGMMFAGRLDDHVDETCDRVFQALIDLVLPVAGRLPDGDVRMKTAMERGLAMPGPPDTQPH